MNIDGRRTVPDMIPPTFKLLVISTLPLSMESPVTSRVSVGVDY